MMSANNKSIFNSHLVAATERRQHPRSYLPFAAEVKGVDAAGAEFEARAMIDNISASGLYLRLTQRVETEAKLSAVVQFTTVTAASQHAPRLAVYGVVRRTEPQADGRCGIAVEFMNQRFL